MISNEKIAIIGGGQQGTSLALAIRAAYPDRPIVILETKRYGLETFESNKERFFSKFADEKCSSEGIQFTDDPSCVKKARFVILQTPISQFRFAVQAIAPHLEPTTILVDNGSIKERAIQEIGDAIRDYVKVPIAFVPTHLLNGNAGSGASTGGKNVYSAPCAIIADKSPEFAVNAVESLLQNIGARKFRISAEKHDKLLATMSPLEYLAMFAFMATKTARTLTTSIGLTDHGNWVQRMTRIADTGTQDGAEVWVSIYEGNQSNVLETARALRRVLVNIKDQLAKSPEPLADTASTAHIYANRTIDPEQNYTCGKPAFPIQPFKPNFKCDGDLALYAFLGLLSRAITENVMRTEAETGVEIGPIANPSLKDGLAPTALALDVVRQLVEHNKEALPAIFDDYLSSFDQIVGMVERLNPCATKMNNAGQHITLRLNTQEAAPNEATTPAREELKKHIIEMGVIRRMLARVFEKPQQQPTAYKDTVSPQ